MVLVDYIGILFTCGNTFGHILYTKQSDRFNEKVFLFFSVSPPHTRKI